MLKGGCHALRLKTFDAVENGLCAVGRLRATAERQERRSLQFDATRIDYLCSFRHR